MISSKKRTGKKSGKLQKARSRPSHTQPDWDVSADNFLITLGLLCTEVQMCL